jgi:GAF domain-containing protein
LSQLLTLILDAAVEAVGFDGATATVRQGEDSGTVASTSARLVALDSAQYAEGDGPCLEALERDQAVKWTAADDDDRWRAFQEAAEELGIATSLSVPLPIDETMEIAASLNLYASQREQVTSEQLELAMQFAFQLATALQLVGTAKGTAEIARRAAQAIRSRAVIEQAKGVLMARRGLSSNEAASVLAGMADARSATLREMALRIIHPEEPDDPPSPD